MQSVLLVGLGNIGLNYDLNREVTQSTVTHAGVISNILKPSIFFAVDLNDTNRKCFNRKYESLSFESVSELPTGLDPDLIVIATPTEGRAQLLQELLKFRNATFLIEKPFASSFTELAELVSFANGYASNIFVNYQRRSSPTIKELRERIQNRHHKTPVEVIATYSGDSKSNSAHMFDLFSYLFSDQQFKINKSPDSFLPDLKGDLVNIRLNHLNFSSISVFELKVFSQDFVAVYDSTFDSISYSYSTNSEFYEGETIYNSLNPVIKQDSQTGLESVYQNILKRESNQEYELCSFVDAIATSKLHLEYWDGSL